MRAAIASTLLAAMLGGCTFTATVPPIDGSQLTGVGRKQPGRYAAFVQTGGWDMNTQLSGLSCAAHSFQVDLNAPWQSAMAGALGAAIEQVDILPGRLSPADLRPRGYAGQIDITQLNAKSQAAVREQFLSASVLSQTELQALLVITFPGGQRAQEILTGQGVGGAPTFTCSGVPVAVGNAAGAATRDLIPKIVNAIKILLAQHR